MCWVVGGNLGPLEAAARIHLSNTVSSNATLSFFFTAAHSAISEINPLASDVRTTVGCVNRRRVQNRRLGIAITQGIHNSLLDIKKTTKIEPNEGFLNWRIFRIFALFVAIVPKQTIEYRHQWPSSLHLPRSILSNARVDRCSDQQLCNFGRRVFYGVDCSLHFKKTKIALTCIDGFDEHLFLSFWQSGNVPVSRKCLAGDGEAGKLQTLLEPLLGEVSYFKLGVFAKVSGFRMAKNRL
jgi:hypothetical protein